MTEESLIILTWKAFGIGFAPDETLVVAVRFRESLDSSHLTTQTLARLE